jgi:two-component sensor histidine kinase
LVTNAVRYGVPEVILTVHDGDGHLHVEVQDGGRSFDPSVGRLDGGFGLPIVAKLSEDWGIEDNDQGLLVWAKLSPDPSPR